MSIKIYLHLLLRAKYGYRFRGDHGHLHQELFLTETAQYADVILPAASFAETDGTFTNTEHRVQRVRKAINPLPGKTNWQAVMELGLKMDYPMNYRTWCMKTKQQFAWPGIQPGQA